jgi:hypothetical protein
MFWGREGWRDEKDFDCADIVSKQDHAPMDPHSSSGLGFNSLLIFL